MTETPPAHSSDGLHDADEPPQPIHALLSGIVDYAGLFPPAKLAMEPAVANYAAYLRLPESWMLGRFILPVSRLEEFRRASADLLPTGPGGAGGRNGRGPSRTPGDGGGTMVPGTHEHHADEPWPMSALIDGDLDENLDAIFAFNREHTRPDMGLAVIDGVEIKVPEDGAAVFIDEALDLIPEEIFPFFEIPVLSEGGKPEPDLRGLIAALSGSDAGAKIRTGGLTRSAFPSSQRIAEFIAACQAADVPFKATAGLHHPVRSEHPLTYEAGCERGVMPGFLNVFIAAALLHARKIDAKMMVDVLEERDGAAFVFTPTALRYRGVSLDGTDLAATRETFALSFGSCSFTEPVADLRSLGLL